MYDRERPERLFKMSHDGTNPSVLLVCVAGDTIDDESSSGMRILPARSSVSS